MLYLQIDKPLHQQVSHKAKKLVSVLAISTSINESSKKTKL